MLTQQKLHRPVGNRPRTFERRTHRKFQFDRKIPQVLLRNETLRDNAGQHENTDYGNAEEREHPSGIVDGQAHHLRKK